VISKLPSWNAILTPKAGWATLAVATEDEIEIFVQAAPAEPAAAVRIVRGRHCPTKQDLFHEWAAVLQFPSYFGENWDAFEECIADREWMQGGVHVVVLTATDRVLSEDKKERTTFLRILKAVAEESERPPLRIVFQCDAKAERATRALLAREDIEP
jgi:RNAse (barnase) inhibitor barstar